MSKQNCSIMNAFTYCSNIENKGTKKQTVLTMCIT